MCRSSRRVSDFVGLMLDLVALNRGVMTCRWVPFSNMLIKKKKIFCCYFLGKSFILKFWIKKERENL